MKIYLHPYQLQARNIVREGVLIKVEWTANSFGYSDLHPWPEFGDEPLEEQIEHLANSEMTPLLKRSLELNSIDHRFRSSNRSAFLGLSLPSVHKLIRTPEQLAECDEFTHAKLKLGKDLVEDAKFLAKMVRETELKIRLDFNGRLEGGEFTNWWEALPLEVRRRIDFVEDPGVVKIRGPWAADWQDTPLAEVKVVKPAREDASVAKGFKRVVFTHSLDHTLGVSAGLWAAASYYRENPNKLEVCGLGAPAYNSDEFSREWNCSGPRMKPPQGTGFGFDRVLARLSWDRIL